MNILLIGGSGFVSGATARLALNEGHRVWAITRGQRPLPAGVVSLCCDRFDRPAVARAIAAVDEDWDLVVDCIAYEPETMQHDVELFRDRADHLVFISTDFVFDPEGRTFPQRDDNPYFLTNDTYGANKRRCEQALICGDTGRMKWTVLRPCHIYGPGSKLGCLPAHSRDVQLIDRLRRGEVVQLVGGGVLLQQPIFVRDLARLILSCANSEQCHGGLYLSYGPDIIESRQYYQIIADILGVPVRFEDLPMDSYLAANPHHRSFLCHRFASLDHLRDAGLAVPATTIYDGLEEHVRSLEAA